MNAQPDTKTSLLDAAESLFAELGIDGASLRAITTRAGVNIAAANYHFGSKDALLRAVVARRMRPVNQQRIDALDAVEAEAVSRGDAPPLESVVRAFVAPILQSCAKMPDGGRTFAQLCGRVLMGHDERLRAVVHEELTEIITRFVAAFSVALPHLEPAELMLRIHFTVGAMAHAVAGRDMLDQVFGDRIDVDDLEAITERLVAFLTPALAAPPTALETK